MRRGLLAHFRDDTRATTTVEFVLLLPLLLILIFGVLDVGGYAWQLNLNSKAVQFGTRLAVVTSPVAPGLVTQSFLGTYGGTTLTQGDIIPANAISTITCASTGGTCAGCTLDNCARDSAAFDRIVARMRGIAPNIQAANITVEYRGSGLGYAGDPNGMEIAPLTTVRLQNVNYKPIMGLIFGSQGITMPSSSYTLTMEDGEGAFSN